MIGMFALFIIALWGSACFGLVWIVLFKMKMGVIKIAINTIIGVILFVSPFYDEFIGREEFFELCNKEAVVKLEGNYARGKIIVSGDVKKVKLYTKTLPIRKETWVFNDAATGELLLSWNEFRSEGGWVSQRLKIFGEPFPLTFVGHCYPTETWNKAFEKYGLIKKINIM